MAAHLGSTSSVCHDPWGREPPVPQNEARQRRPFALSLFHSYPRALTPPPSFPYSCPFLPERLGNEPSLSTYVTSDYRVWLWSKSDLKS